MKHIPILLCLLLVSCGTPLEEMERRSLGKIQRIEAVAVDAMTTEKLQITTDKTVVFVFNHPRFCLGDELIGYFDEGRLDAVVDCDNYYRSCANF